MTIEVAQRAAGPAYSAARVIDGLDHIGLPSADLAQRMEAPQAAGFTPAFAPVRNHTPREGTILCCMLCRGDLTLEVYQFCGYDAAARLSSPRAGPGGP